MGARLVVLAALLLGLAAPAGAVEVNGVQVAEKVALADGGPELVLNGAGTRVKVFFKVYVAGLYLAKKEPKADAVLADAGPKRVMIHILRDEISAETFVKALEEGIGDNHGEAQVAALAADTKTFGDAMRAVGKVTKGQVVLIDYLPGAGLKLILDGKPIASIAGDAFYKALLRVWLGEHPVDAALKKAMLGG